MKPGLIALVVVLLLGVGLLVWNLSSGPGKSAPQLAPDTTTSTKSATPGLASLEKPTADAHAAKTDSATNPSEGRTSAAQPEQPWVDTSATGIGAADIDHAGLDDHGLGKKYAAMSEPERTRALAALQLLYESNVAAGTTSDKGQSTNMDELKFEMGWLQGHLTP